MINISLPKKIKVSRATTMTVLLFNQAINFPDEPFANCGGIGPEKFDTAYRNGFSYIDPNYAIPTNIPNIGVSVFFRTVNASYFMGTGNPAPNNYRESWTRNGLAMKIVRSLVQPLADNCYTDSMQASKYQVDIGSQRLI